MRRTAVFLVLFGVVALRAWSQAPPREPPHAGSTAVIRGRVLSGDIDVPVRKARLTLTPDTPAGVPGDPIYSGEDGRFEFTGVTPGRYAISAWKSGYAPAIFGARSAFEPAVHVVVGAGDAVAGLRLALQKGASVSGRVTDEFGEPMTGIAVSVGPVAITGDRVEFGPGSTSVDTDDLGEYRIGGLPAGSYLASASGFVPLVPAAGGSPDEIAARSGEPRWEATFYPEGRRPAQARPIVLAAGEDAVGIDMRMVSQASGVVTVSGRIVDPEDRGTGSGFRLTTSTATSGNPAGAMNMMRGVPPSGEFTIPLEPGDYVLTAQGAGGIAVQRLSVDENGISGIQLTLTQGARISGRVVFEGAAHRPSVSIAAFPAGSDLRLSQQIPFAALGPSGAFTLTHLIGPREIRVARLPASWIVKSITAGGRSIADVPIDLRSGDDLHDVVIVLTDQSTALSGTVLDDQKRPAPGASVIVFADDRRQLLRRARWVRADTDGHFVIAGLPPGDYLAVAIADVDDVRWQTPEYLEPFRSRAVRVSLAAGATATIALSWRSDR